MMRSITVPITAVGEERGPIWKVLPMAAGLQTVELKGNRIAQLLPLVQSRRPDLSLDVLRDAMTRADPDDTADGLLAFENSRGYVVGVCTYAIVPDMLDGPILYVNHFIPTDVLGRYHTVETMIAEIEALARRQGCTAIQVNLQDQATMFPRLMSPVVTKFQQAGHECDGLILRKKLDRAQPGDDRAVTPDREKV